MLLHHRSIRKVVFSVPMADHEVDKIASYKIATAQTAFTESVMV